MEHSNDQKAEQHSSGPENLGHNSSGTPPQKEKQVLKVATGLLLAAVLGVAVYYIFANNNAPQYPLADSSNGQNMSQTAETVQPRSERLPVIIYTEELKSVDTDSRSWPTVRILRKIGASEPEVLAEVGTIGEYPSSFHLSPDNKTLLINLESKLQVLSLATKEIKDLFVPKRQILGVSYSPNAQQLFIWDQKYAPTDGNNNYYAHLFTFADQKDQIVKQGNSTSPFFVSVWRNDDKVILREALGEFSIPWSFDLSSNQMSKTKGGPAFGFISESGKVMAVVEDSVSDVCNDFSGSAPSVYNVVDPVSGKIVGTIGGSGNRVSVLAFSADDTEVLYQAEKPWTNRNDCKKIPERSYYKVQVSSGQATQLSNVADALKSWNVKYVGATAEYDYNNSTWSILINDQRIVLSSKELRLVGQFYD